MHPKRAPRSRNVIRQAIRNTAPGGDRRVGPPFRGKHPDGFHPHLGAPPALDPARSSATFRLVASEAEDGFGFLEFDELGQFHFFV